MSATVDAHNQGDCWPPICPVCAYEDQLVINDSGDDQ